jgi:hypothetical protein
MDDGSIHCVAGEVFVPESGATFGSIATSQLGAWLHFVPLVQLFHSFSFFFSRMKGESGIALIKIDEVQTRYHYHLLQR